MGKDKSDCDCADNSLVSASQRTSQTSVRHLESDTEKNIRKALRLPTQTRTRQPGSSSTRQATRLTDQTRTSPTTSQERAWFDVLDTHWPTHMPFPPAFPWLAGQVTRAQVAEFIIHNSERLPPLPRHASLTRIGESLTDLSAQTLREIAADTNNAKMLTTISGTVGDDTCCSDYTLTVKYEPPPEEIPEEEECDTRCFTHEEQFYPAPFSYVDAVTKWAHLSAIDNGLADFFETYSVPVDGEEIYMDLCSALGGDIIIPEYGDGCKIDENIGGYTVGPELGFAILISKITIYGRYSFFVPANVGVFINQAEDAYTGTWLTAINHAIEEQVVDDGDGNWHCTFEGSYFAPLVLAEENLRVNVVVSGAEIGEIFECKMIGRVIVSIDYCVL